MPPVPLFHGQANFARSPHHYYTGCDLIIRAENVLYGVDEISFKSRSGKLEEILDMHRAQDERVGSSDERPLVIEVSAESMDSFMEALWHRRALRNFSGVGKLVHVLHLSHLFEVQDLYQQTVQKLHHHPEFNDWARLRWSLEANVEDWFEPAFVALASRPVSAMPLGALVVIGETWLYELIQTRKMIEVTRALHALSDPIWEAIKWCNRKKRCSSGWITFWRRNVAPILLGDLPFSDTMFANLETSNPPNICARCFRSCMTIARVTLSDEERILHEEVERIRGEFFGH